MKNSRLDNMNRRIFVKFIGLLPWVSACRTTERMQDVKIASDERQKRFNGIGMMLVVDAVAGAEMGGVVLYDDRQFHIYTSSLVSKKVRAIMALGGTRVPVTVRALWRANPTPIWGKNGGIDYEGAIAGDFTTLVAERIPDKVLDDLRAHKGNLRLKFRLKPDGILFGWDIERASLLGNVSIFESPGGDFLETHY